MTDFVRDESHWLFKFSPQEWIHAGMAELRRAEAAYKQRNATAGLAGSRRAAGMALNGALIAEPNERWGRTYADHLLALQEDMGVPLPVRAASKFLMDTQPARGNIIPLRSKVDDERVLEAARDVMAHAYAVVARDEAKSRS